MLPAAGLDDRIPPIEDERSVQQLAARHACAVDIRNLADLGGLFSTQTNIGEHGSGEDGARAFYDRVLAGFYRSFHQIVGHVITDIDADSARGTVYCRAEHEDGDHWIVNLMVYFDRYKIGRAHV